MTGLLLVVFTESVPAEESIIGLAAVKERLPPSVVNPPLTVKLLVPVTVVAPFRETLPVPVENVPLPL